MNNTQENAEECGLRWAAFFRDLGLWGRKVERISVEDPFLMYGSQFTMEKEIWYTSKLLRTLHYVQVLVVG